ncbi:thioesterase II family protein [Microlunatus speluncae]|uniref:thioesterase II family protein n=1 Tax=Microlunatus speluncae TaxID=2594267 RepID=UPI003CCD472A
MPSSSPRRSRLTTPWLHGPVEPVGDGIRLFCIPYAGGSATPYLTWRSKLPQIDLQPVRLPGRLERASEPQIRRLPALVNALAEALAPFASESFAIFGHSMGALVALELARRFEARGRPPTHVFVSGHPSPEQPWRIETGLHLAPEASIIEFLRGLLGTPEELLQDPETRALIVSSMRGDLELVETYNYVVEPRLACAVTTLYGADDATIDQVAGWKDVTSGPWSCYAFAGGHFFPFGESRDDVLATIATTLSRPGS